MKNLISLIVLIIVLPTKSFAWGEKGHSLVAEIAFKQLNKKIQKQIKKSLDGLSIEEAANWMDVIKNDPSYDGLKPLHYINCEKDAELKDTCCDNIVYTLEKTISELKNYQKLSKEELKMKLCFLFHLIGDLHQPLHVGYGSDKGGNKLQIRFNGKGTNLHSFFDYNLIENENISLKDCMTIEKYSPEELTKLQSGSILDWAKESRNFLNDMYAKSGSTISPDYLQKNTVFVEKQIQKAGIRLAGILKSIFEAS